MTRNVMKEERLWSNKDIRGLEDKSFMDSLLDAMMSSDLDKDIIKKIIEKPGITEQEICDIYNRETGESISPEELYVHRNLEFTSDNCVEYQGALREGVEDMKIQPAVSACRQYSYRLKETAEDKFNKKK